MTEEEGLWTIKTSNAVKSIELKFKIGEKFEETTPDGRRVDSIVTVEGNKFICVQTAKKEGEKSTKSTREFTDTGCTWTIEVTGTDVVSVQEFKRVEDKKYLEEVPDQNEEAAMHEWLSLY